MFFIISHLCVMESGHQKNNLVLLGQLTGLGLLQLPRPGDALEAEHTTSPVLAELLVALVEVVLDRLGQLVQRDAVVTLNVGQSDAGAGLATDQQSQASLALDDDVWDSHLAAQSGQVQDQLEMTRLVSGYNFTGNSFQMICQWLISGVMVSTRNERVSPIASGEEIQIKWIHHVSSGAERMVRHSPPEDQRRER